MEPGTIKSATGRHHHHSPTISKTKHRIPFLSSILAALVVVVFALLGLVELHHNQRPVLPWWPPLLSSSSSPPSNARILRRYSLTVRSRWMNPDGGRWRVMLVCNGETPCPTLLAEEGDLVQLTVHNDLYAQSSIHWSGRTYKSGPWNDGTPGISQFPMLPRANWTSTHDTTGQWGLNWYAEHATAGSADGLYGLIYVAPSPNRPRPYHLITKDPVQLKLIHEAEKRIKHFVIKNHQGRDSTWKLLRMRAEGSEFYCYDSFLLNGKGRVHCRQPGYEMLGGHHLDETGCIQPKGMPEESCTPSTADYQIIETNGQQYLMLNLLNAGFEHSVRVSIDGHKLIVVANDGGFVEPQEVDAVYVMSAARVTVLIKLDADAGPDFAMRIASTSQWQNLHGYALLRYPGKHHQPILGAPMELPEPASADDICVLPDGSVPAHCSLADPIAIPPYPALPVPIATKVNSQHSWPLLTGKKDRSVADFTFRLAVGVQPSQTEPHAPEYLINKKPWQLFRSSMMPLLFEFAEKKEEEQEKGAHRFAFDDPILPGPFPIGSVVDLVIENTLNETVTLYKHGAPTWLLGSGDNGRFPYDSVYDAVHNVVNHNNNNNNNSQAHFADTAQMLNLENPGRHIVHEVPPLGWSIIRFQVISKEVTMLHAVKLRHFALGMSMPILEGLMPEDLVSVPAYAANRPHIEFEPKNDGVFG